MKEFNYLLNKKIRNEVQNDELGRVGFAKVSYSLYMLN